MLRRALLVVLLTSGALLYWFGESQYGPLPYDQYKTAIAPLAWYSPWENIQWRRRLLLQDKACMERRPECQREVRPMPYRVEYHKGGSRPWKIVKSETGRIVGSSKTKADAEASIRARHASEKKTGSS